MITVNSDGERPADFMLTDQQPLLDAVTQELCASAAVKERMATEPRVIVDIALEFVHALKAGRKLLFCGNGGSAADALHLATEFVGRYRLERDPLPAIALPADLSTVTAIANDYNYALVFARQVKALGNPGDVLVGISTSGRAANVLMAIDAARTLGLRVIVLTGRDGGDMATRADLTLRIPSTDTARIQEGYMAAAHAVCGLVERMLFGDLRDAHMLGRSTR